MWAEYLKDKPHLLLVIDKYTVNCDINQKLQFKLDCMVIPDVISLKQQYGKCVHDSLLYLTRTLCFSVHKSRYKLIGKWNLKN